MKGCMSALFPTNTSFKQKNLTKVIFKMSKQRRAHTMARRRQRQQQHERGQKWRKRKFTAVVAHIKYAATAFSHLWLFRSSHKAQPSAVILQRQLYWKQSALVLKLIFAAFYIFYSEKALGGWWKRELLLYLLISYTGKLFLLLAAQCTFLLPTSISQWMPFSQIDGG